MENFRKFAFMATICKNLLSTNHILKKIKRKLQNILIFAFFWTNPEWNEILQVVKINSHFMIFLGTVRIKFKITN